MKIYGLRLQENKGEKTMNDNDIIKALEHCAEGGYCGDCGYDIKSAKCIANIMKDSIDLITSQNAEIERLRECPKCVYEYDGDMTEFCVEAPCSNYKTADEIRSEAIKEFAERLKETKVKHGNDFMVYADNIDTLVKKMVGDGK